MKPRNYLLLLFLPAMVVAGYFLAGWWNFLVPFCCFVAYPVANLFIPSSNAHEHTHTDNYPSAAYSLVALCFVPVLVTLTCWAVYIAGNTVMDAVSFTGLVLSVGLVNTVLGFTLAHEFIHRFSKTEQVAGYLLLLLNNYMHYGIEHVWGHHVYACTPEDPHTARIGESLYTYLPRAIKATYKNAIKIETKKLSRSSYNAPFIHNRIVLFGLLQMALMLLIFLLCGIQSLMFFLLQNIVAIMLLHIINYLQHYGLMRQKKPGGDYEKLGSLHAWNACHERKSINIFQLENHADHHIHPARPYEKLSHHDDSPAHPASYSSMVLLSLVPPLWFRIMNKKITSNFLNTHNMKTQHTALPGNALNTRAIYLLAFLSTVALSGCYLNFYRPNTKSTLDSGTAQKLQSVNKYFIVHFQNGIKGLENVAINGDTLNGIIVKLPEEHSKYLAPVSEKKNRVKQRDKQNTLMEVHLYSMQKPGIEDSIFSAPLSSFTRTDIYELNKAATTTNHILSTVGIVASVAAIVGIIAAASYTPPDIVIPTVPDPCNCPQVYMKNNEGYSFASGLYSGAVYSTLERMDYLPLTSVPNAANNISFKIANAKNEEQFINQVQLLQVNHPVEIKVLANRQGNILSYQNAVAPLTASTEKNNDVKNLLAQTDEQYYSFDNKANNDGFSDLTLTFNKPADAQHAKLLIHARNTFWGSLLHKEFMHLFGDSFEKWRTKQENADPKELAKWQTDQALPLMVYIKTANGWKFVDYFPIIGNTASRDMIMEINTAGIATDKIEIKLETTYRFWDLDFAGIDYSTNQQFETSIIEPLQAIKTDGTNQKEILLQSDKQYTQLTGDQSISFEYKVAGVAPNTVSSYFLVSGGYYHNLETISGKTNYKELYKFRNKAAYDKFSRTKYQEGQDITAALQKKIAEKK